MGVFALWVSCVRTKKITDVAFLLFRGPRRVLNSGIANFASEKFHAEILNHALNAFLLLI